MFGRRRRISILFAALLMASLATGLSATTAGGEPSDPVVEVQFLVDGEEGNGFLLVGGTLPPEASLPATLSLPVPQGATIWWAGELGGGGPDSDTEREAAVVDGEGGPIVQFRLETARAGQYDAIYLPTEVTDDRRNGILSWVQSSPASRLVFSIIFPAGAQDMSIDPMPASGPTQNSTGESLFLLPQIEEPTPGTTFMVEASYGSGAPGADASTAGRGTLLLVLGAVIAVFAVALVLAVRSQLRSHAADEPGELIE